jgi:hypothetical protein
VLSDDWTRRLLLRWGVGSNPIADDNYHLEIIKVSLGTMLSCRTIVGKL